MFVYLLFLGKSCPSSWAQKRLQIRAASGFSRRASCLSRAFQEFPRVRHSSHYLKDQNKRSFVRCLLDRRFSNPTPTSHYQGPRYDWIWPEYSFKWRDRASVIHWIYWTRCRDPSRSEFRRLCSAPEASSRWVLELLLGVLASRISYSPQIFISCSIWVYLGPSGSSESCQWSRWHHLSGNSQPRFCARLPI
jgi:hypothetical protein